ncbi:YdiK family protein [Tenuibacillus multivorans]|uniref:DUF4305 domain-containing protein n=1 Tax=Tenuibacillus multivorans TaxID=237069 RepID=A0A1H0E457_9BACI|nr:YdiK family protein [Tenuibacillus multivorans]GEL76659.1 hypothetical protein TMU01_08940 [Tenuibacillus multivorans]SDN77180.1 protein of unknown function [Tenuibacillus multivorans]
MRVSPVFIAFMYLLMGLAFIYIALRSADETVWNLTTIIFTIVAALDFGVAIRMLARYFSHKK